MAKFQTLVDVYQSSIKTFPDLPLFGTKRGGHWEWMTYLEFGKMTDGLRAGLAGLGFTKGDRIVIISNNRPEWAIAAYACFGLGIAFVPIYEAQLPKDWEFIINDCQAKGVIVATDAICEKTRAFLDSVPSLEFIISLDAATKADGSTTNNSRLMRNYFNKRNRGRNETPEICGFTVVELIVTIAVAAVLMTLSFDLRH